MRLLLSLSLCFSSLALLAQSYSGTVYLGCTLEPIEGITVQAQGRVGFQFLNFTTTTDANGDYIFNGLFGTDDTWRIFIPRSIPGRATPLDYEYYPSAGSKTNLNFHFLVQPPMRHGVNGNSNDISTVFPPTSPSFNPVQHCVGSGDCLFIPDAYAAETYWRSSTERVCFSATVYELKFNGNRSQTLGTLPCVEITGTPPPLTGCARYSFDFDALVASSVGENVEIEITQNCCQNNTTCPASNASAHTWSQYFTIGGLSQTTVDFTFNVSSSIDADNPGDDPLDLMEPRSNTIAGAPSIGCRSSGISTTVSSPSPVESITYNVYEVVCSDPDNATLIATRVLNLQGNPPPSNYSFQEFEDAQGNELLCPRGGQAGKCFLMEVIASNDCGDVSETSFFTVNQSFNLPTGGPDIDNEMNTSTVGRITDGGFGVYPNPAEGQLTIDYQLAGATFAVEVMTVNGAFVRSIQDVSHLQTIDISGLVTGVYFIRPLVADVQAVRFVKR